MMSGCVVVLVLLAAWVPVPAVLGENGTTSLGDVFLDRVREECLDSRSAAKCFKYKLVKYVYKWTTDDRRVSTTLWGPISIISTPRTTSSVPMFAESEPRSSDSELEQLEKFAYRQLERLVSSHALLWTLPSGLQGARLIEDNDLTHGVEEGRRGRRKKLSILFPLLLFMKLKAILVPILLIVIFIKKMLVVGYFLAPSFLAQLKHKEHLAHTNSHEHAHDHSSEWAGYSGDNYGRIGKRDAQEMAYQGYKKVCAWRPNQLANYSLRDGL